MWTFRFYKPHSFLRFSVVSYLKNIFISLFLISLLPAQEAGNTIAVLLFEDWGIAQSEFNTLIDYFTPDADSLNEELPLQQQSKSLPSNTCRVLATVYQLNDPTQQANLSAPCDKAPCFGKLRIDSVIGYGAAFPRPISPGDSLAVRFMYTAGMTGIMWPELHRDLPGLSIGDTFKVDILGVNVMSRNGSPKTEFRIYVYELLRQSHD